MDEWVVTGVEEATDDSGKHEFWVIVYQVPETVHPDGVWRYHVHKGAIEGRAAEYGLTTVDEVLEILTFEPLLAPLQASGELPMLIPSAMDAASARAAVAEQIDTCKRRHGRVSVTGKSRKALAAKADPLQTIRDRVRVDPVRTAVMRLEIDRARLSRG
ncbi:hypothetical protein AB0C10_15730 [Microbispora amethystogenes]|uniref:hypothetical protein n=1 Tax=Microbispora amethystogenes TaxID=1427754 RepID=UPI0033C6C228